ncbi:MAG: hypothetical protein K9M54_01855 [Kiritimatiellales bacterium]|nr:hypothetical protein [Kiritimatiellales bacterium]MCF7864011.1 hypothetical protein [Kiritimatiellales bacterium]
MAGKKTSSNTKTSANFGFEATLWLTADKLQNNMGAAAYNQSRTLVVLLPKLLGGGLR